MSSTVVYVLCGALAALGVALLSWDSVKAKLPFSGKYLDRAVLLISKAIDRDETPTVDQARAAIILLSKFDSELNPQLREIYTTIEQRVTDSLFGEDVKGK